MFCFHAGQASKVTQPKLTETLVRERFSSKLTICENILPVLCGHFLKCFVKIKLNKGKYVQSSELSFLTPCGQPPLHVNSSRLI